MASEKESALEENLIKKLSGNGYERVKLPDTQALEENFRKQVERHNNIKLSDAEFKKIRNHLDGGSVFEKARKLRDKFTLIRSKQNKYIEFINTKEWCKNIFQVTNQLTNRSGKYENRYDVTILINGLPLVQIELKRRGMEIKQAFNQVARYKKDSLSKGLFSYIQIFVISNGLETRYFSNNKELSVKQVFNWTDRENNKITKLQDFAEEFLEKCHLSKMITKYMVLHNSDKTLMILRPYQFYAAESISAKASNSTKNGYIWHTTGSGKTLTSFKTAKLLVENDKIDKVVFVVDRKDLDYQTTKEFNSFEHDAVSGTENTKSLVKQLGKNEKLVLTTIQKLTNAIKKDSHKKVMKSIKDKRFAFIFDECHRSQFGDMHRMITAYFTNHQCFGFTGTPIFAENASGGRTTHDLFGDCLHTYTIKDAIDDGNVLGFSVDYTNTFKLKQGIEDEKVKEIDRKEVREHQDRIDNIVDTIISEHPKKTFNREFNSILAVSNISTLIKYYETFKRKYKNLKIAAIFSFAPNEDPEDQNENVDAGYGISSRDKLEEFMADYNKEFGTNFTTKKSEKDKGKRTADDFNAYYIDVAKKMKHKNIDILLVVNMFLTGFDAKQLNTLYIDKNLRYHGLIQAFSRTNRVFGEKKRHGNIVWFDGNKEDTDQALKLYADEEAQESVIMKPYKEYLQEFNNYLEELKKKYPTTDSIDKLKGEKAKEGFVKLFREILRIKAKLSTFSEFNYNDTPIQEQEFEDFTGKYRDMYNDIKTKTDKDKKSILDDIDFEIDLIRQDDIDVDYILSLLEDLDPKEPGYKAEKERILRTVRNSYELHSKKDLIERFINKEFDPGKDVVSEFEAFLIRERDKELKKICKRENLDKENTDRFLDEYDFTGRMNEELLEDAMSDELGFLERQDKRENLMTVFLNFIEKYSF